jgi:hypothetical protein
MTVTRISSDLRAAAGIRRRSGVCLILIALAIDATAAAGTPKVAAESYTATELNLASWQIRALGKLRASGSLCWIRGDGGEIRLEVAAWPGSEPPESPLSVLLEREGEGWTMTSASSDAEDTDRPLVKPWGAEWRNVHPQVAAVATAIVDAMEGDQAVEPSAQDGVLTMPSARDGRSGWRRPGSLRRAARRIELPAEWDPGARADNRGEARGKLRSDLVERGRGRGAAAEILDLSWERSETETPCLRIVSSRRTGELRLERHSSLLVRHPGWETFVPIWTLGELLELQ